MHNDIVVAMIGIVPALVSSILTYVISRRRKKPEQEQVQPSLVYHPLFVELETIENFFLVNYSIGDPGRTELAVELIVNMIRIWKPILKRLAKSIEACTADCEFDENTCTKIYNENMKTFNEGLLLCSKWHDMTDSHKALRMQRLYNCDSRETFKVYTKKFNAWQESRYDTIRAAIQEYSHSSVSHGCCDKQRDIFTMYMFMFVQMKLDAENTLKELNGELTGKNFLGITIGDV